MERFVEFSNSLIAMLIKGLSPEFIFILDIIDKVDKLVAFGAIIAFLITKYYCPYSKKFNFDFDIGIIDDLMSFVPFVALMIPIRLEFYAILIIADCVLFVTMVVFAIRELVLSAWILSIDKSFAMHLLNLFVRALLVLVTLNDLIECYMLVA